MIFVFETRHRMIGLRLQKCCIDTAFAHRDKTRHSSAFQEIGDQRCDEDRLARTCKTRNTKADHGLEEGFGHCTADPVRPTQQIIRNRSNAQTVTLLLP